MADAIDATLGSEMRDFLSKYILGVLGEGEELSMSKNILFGGEREFYCHPRQSHLLFQLFTLTKHYIFKPEV